MDMARGEFKRRRRRMWKRPPPVGDGPYGGDFSPLATCLPDVKNDPCARRSNPPSAPEVLSRVRRP